MQKPHLEMVNRRNPSCWSWCLSKLEKLVENLRVVDNLHRPISLLLEPILLDPGLLIGPFLRSSIAMMPYHLKRRLEEL